MLRRWFGHIDDKISNDKIVKKKIDWNKSRGKLEIDQRRNGWKLLRNI